LWEARPETANRLRSRVEAILDWAKARGHRSGDNPAAWDVIGKVLPARRAKQHHAAMAYKDIPAFMAELRTHKVVADGVAAKAMQFLVYTAARSQEVLKARWSEIDLDAVKIDPKTLLPVPDPVWNVPASRMKARKPHRVPLAPPAVDLLRSLYTESGNDLVFLGTQPGKPLAHTTLGWVLKRMGQPVFRSSFRDWAGETTAFPHDVCEAALAHVRGDQSVQAYARGDLFDKRRKLMEAWADYCAKPVVKTDATVTPIRKR
jgi:integrase